MGHTEFFLDGCGLDNLRDRKVNLVPTPFQNVGNDIEIAYFKRQISELEWQLEKETRRRVALEEFLAARMEEARIAQEDLSERLRIAVARWRAYETKNSG